MEDEIKEILEIRSVEQQAIDNLKAIISCDDKIIEIEPPLEDTAQILLDYITNLQEEKYKIIHTSIVQKKQLTNKLNKLNNKYNDLQQENERLKLAIKNHSIIIPKNKVIDYKSRIEKAIGYIKNINERAYKDDYGTCFSTYDLLNILQGD